MGVLRLALGASLLTGCQWALALKDYPPRTDANLDGVVPQLCSGKSPAPALCADFDEPAPMIWLDGTPSLLSLQGTNVAASVGGPARVGPGALHLVSQGGTFFKAYLPSGKMSTMTASFDITIEQQANNTLTNSEFVRLTALNTSLASCYVDFYLDQAVPSLRIQDACGSGGFVEFNAGVIPSDWFHVDFALDLTVPRATIAINGTTHELQFGGMPIGPHEPQIEFGIGVPGTDGLRVAYDQLVVTTTP